MFGLEVDEVAAFEYHKKAADDGDECAQYAQYRLGKAYENGELGLEKNEETAFQYYRKAADGGHEYAQCAQYRLFTTRAIRAMGLTGKIYF